MNDLRTYLLDARRSVNDGNTKNKTLKGLWKINRQPTRRGCRKCKDLEIKAAEGSTKKITCPCQKNNYHEKYIFPIEELSFFPQFHFSRFQFNLAALVCRHRLCCRKLPGRRQTSSVFAVNGTTKTWTFNTANAGNYTYDTSLTVDDTAPARSPASTKSSIRLFFEPSSWSLAAVAGSTTPAGWVVVPKQHVFNLGFPGDEV
jgi:hypothetical protein